MTLDEYLKTTGRKAREFAVAIERSESTISKIVNGAVCDAETARRIYAETGGCVTPNDLFGLHRPAEAPEESGEVPGGADARNVDDIPHAPQGKRANGTRLREVLP
jgi:hypothetical protein